MYTDLTNLCVRRADSIRDAMTRIDRSRLGIVLVVDDDGRLAGTITDGDLRRATLADIDFSLPAEDLLLRKAGSSYAVPISAPIGASPETLLSLLQEHRVNHLPLIDDDRRVRALVTIEEFLPSPVSSLRAVVMAGGVGSRLRPLTDTTPKPMLPVGDRPLMQIMIEQLRDVGITNVSVTTHHNSEKITEHFGDGSEFGIALNYVAEDRPLGTIGALGLMPRPTDTTLVINGDILTQVDFGAMLAYHRSHEAQATIAVRRYEVQLPYGVVENDGERVVGLREKPQVGFLVNAGIYLLEPNVHDYIPKGERCDMTTLIERLLAADRRVISFPLREYWLDIGQMDDYQRAQKDVATWRA
jgi:dTDP-glucose pyrophosphorylase